MQSGLDNCEFTEDVIVAALGDNSDIPELSPQFTRRCLAAMCPRRGCRREMLVMLASAAIASFATWLAAYPFFARSPRPEAAAAQYASRDSSIGLLPSAIARNAAGNSSMSNECVVNADPFATVHWKTLNAGQSQMAWEWPEGAHSAKLRISNRSATVEKLFDVGDVFPVWRPDTPKVFDEDDVYTAKLTFYRELHGRGDAISTMSAEGLGFVHGISSPGKAASSIPIALATVKCP